MAQYSTPFRRSIRQYQDFQIEPEHEKQMLVDCSKSRIAEVLNTTKRFLVLCCSATASWIHAGF